MITSVLDASAVLAYLLDEPGTEVVKRALAAGSACSAVNYSEVAQKIMAAGGDWGVAASVLEAMGVEIVDAGAPDAIAAAMLWHQGTAQSLGDRFCLATAARLDVPALTADRAWGEGEGIRQIR